MKRYIKFFLSGGVVMGFNSGSHTCQADALPFEPLHQATKLLFITKIQLAYKYEKIPLKYT
jgi:hypothetical protein